MLHLRYYAGSPEGRHSDSEAPGQGQEENRTAPSLAMYETHMRF